VSLNPFVIQVNSNQSLTCMQFQQSMKSLNPFVIQVNSNLTYRLLISCLTMPSLNPFVIQVNSNIKNVYTLSIGICESQSLRDSGQFQQTCTQRRRSKLSNKSQSLRDSGQFQHTANFLLSTHTCTKSQSLRDSGQFQPIIQWQNGPGRNKVSIPS